MTVRPAPWPCCRKRRLGAPPAIHRSLSACRNPPPGRRVRLPAADPRLRARAGAVPQAAESLAARRAALRAKPLPHPAVVQTVIDEGGFLDLATTGEVQLVQRLGVTPCALHPYPPHQAPRGHRQCARLRGAHLRRRQSRRGAQVRAPERESRSCCCGSRSAHPGRCAICRASSAAIRRACSIWRASRPILVSACAACPFMPAHRPPMPPSTSRR